MLFKVTGQLLGTVKRVEESCWETPKGSLICSGQILIVLESCGEILKKP
jgi:hypothetical protein